MCKSAHTTPIKKAQINSTPTKSLGAGPSATANLQSYRIKYPIHHAVRYDNISDASLLMTDANDVATG